MHVYTMLQEQVNSLDCRGMLHGNDTYWYLQYIHPHLQFTKVTRVQWNWAAQNKYLFWVQQPHCFYTYPYKNSPHIKNGTIIAQTKINCWCGLIIFMIPNHTHSPVAVHDALYMSPKHSLLLVQTNFDAKLLFFFDGNSQHIPGLNVRVWQM